MSFADDAVEEEQSPVELKMKSSLLFSHDPRARQAALEAEKLKQQITQEKKAHIAQAFTHTTQSEEAGTKVKPAEDFEKQMRAKLASKKRRLEETKADPEGMPVCKGDTDTSR